MSELKLLLCRKHVEDNIKSYLRKQGIAEAHKINISNDIFLDLIESRDSSELDTKLEVVKDSWGKVNAWFMRYQYESFKSLIRCCREAAGLKGKH